LGRLGPYRLVPPWQRRVSPRKWSGPWPQQPGRCPLVPGTAGPGRPGRRVHVRRDHGRDGSVTRERLGGGAFEPSGAVTPTTDAAARVLRRDGNAVGLRVSRSMSRTMTTSTAPASISQAGSRGQNARVREARTSGTLTDWNAFEKACVCHGVRLSVYRRYNWSNGPDNLDRERMCSACISRTRSLLRSDERAAQRCRKVT
jgi:hypothetical protein